MATQSLEELIRQLPPDLQQEVEDFVEFLIDRRKKTKRKPTFDWAGALRCLKGQYNSVELQHKISEWREEQ